jgi:hypothetical protein
MDQEYAVIWHDEVSAQHAVAGPFDSEGAAADLADSIRVAAGTSEPRVITLIDPQHIEDALARRAPLSDLVDATRATVKTPAGESGARV